MVSTELREVLVRNNKIIKKHIVLFFFFLGLQPGEWVAAFMCSGSSKWIITLWLSIVR